MVKIRIILYHYKFTLVTPGFCQTFLSYITSIQLDYQLMCVVMDEAQYTLINTGRMIARDLVSNK